MLVSQRQTEEILFNKDTNHWLDNSGTIRSMVYKPQFGYIYWSLLRRTVRHSFVLLHWKTGKHIFVLLHRKTRKHRFVLFCISLLLPLKTVPGWTRNSLLTPTFCSSSWQRNKVSELNWKCRNEKLRSKPFIFTKFQLQCDKFTNSIVISLICQIVV